MKPRGLGIQPYCLRASESYGRFSYYWFYYQQMFGTGGAQNRLAERRHWWEGTDWAVAVF